MEQQRIASSINRELGPPAKLKAFDTLSVSPHGASVRVHPNSPLRSALSFQLPQDATTRLPPDLTYSRNNMLCDTVKEWYNFWGQRVAAVTLRRVSAVSSEVVWETWGVYFLVKNADGTHYIKIQHATGIWAALEPPIAVETHSLADIFLREGREARRNRHLGRGVRGVDLPPAGHPGS